MNILHYVNISNIKMPETSYYRVLNDLGNAPIHSHASIFHKDYPLMHLAEYEHFSCYFMEQTLLITSYSVTLKQYITHEI